ncbi:MAG: glycosyltransferase family 2 protein [Deltaproteobacteria bacterium]|nr:glycosyltransferase family 2 protein [Deltaproteobacteria bacterium]
MTAAGARLSVVIVTYHSADLIGPCLESIGHGEDPSVEVFVVDNASPDGTAGFVRRNFPGVALLMNTGNRGFAAANNQALPLCRGEYIVLLNPDTVVRPGVLGALADYMDAHPYVGLAGPRIENPDGTRQDSVSYRYPGGKYAVRELAGLPGAIACVMGACQIVRRKLMEELGGLDEAFFLYAEDQDLCLRIRARGYEIGYLETATILHYGGRSEREFEPIEVFRKKVRAEYRFYRKHYRPETIRRIRRAHLVRSLWRMASIRTLMLVTRDRDAASRKLQKYRAVYEAAHDAAKEAGQGGTGP